MARSLYNSELKSLPQVPCFPSGTSDKEPGCQRRRLKRHRQGQPLGQEEPLEEGTATHSSILAWRILWTEEPGGLQSRWLQRAGLD